MRKTILRAGEIARGSGAYLLLNPEKDRSMTIWREAGERMPSIPGPSLWKYAELSDEVIHKLCGTPDNFSAPTPNLCTPRLLGYRAQRPSPVTSQGRLPPACGSRSRRAHHP
jgi:hypothetical protein